ncbi:MAG: M13 family metallopeptidase N-terminal domain-containing protein, partial [Candidatus Eisenbacteria bacterium]
MSPKFPLLAAFAVMAAITAPVAPAHAANRTLPPDLDPLVRNVDKSVSPGADFFSYANGAWIKANPIPASERGWGIGNLVNEETYRQRVEIMTAAAASGAARGTSAQKVGDFWATGMDSAAIEAAGARPLAPYLAEVGAIADRAALTRTIAGFQSKGFRSLYGLYVGQDERNSEKYVIHFFQGGL